MPVITPPDPLPPISVFQFTILRWMTATYQCLGVPYSTPSPLPPQIFSLGVDDIVQVLKDMSGWYQAMNSILSTARSDPSEKKSSSPSIRGYCAISFSYGRLLRGQTVPYLIAFP